MTTQHPESLEALLRENGTFVVPGAYDALSARIAARSGARVVYMTGFGVAGASFGVPDIGLLGPDQMSERVRAIASAIAPLPLIADGDNGHGGPANVARLVRAYELAGAQCIQLEDQAMPKRCGHMDGKEIVPLVEAAAKIRAAVAARTNISFKIMARTDAIATDGMDEALRRGEAFLNAGADILFVEAARSEEELLRVAQTFPRTPLVANMVEDGKTPFLSLPVLQQMGYRIVLRPVTALLAIARRLEEVYSGILEGNATVGERVTFTQYNEIVGLPEALAFVSQCGEP
ncbi:MAG: isocitrate lyase/PEP mutase family protein [Rhizomicrobium sp.]